MQPPRMIDSYHTLHSIDADRVHMACEHCQLGQIATHYAHTADPGRGRGNPSSLFLCDRCAALLCSSPVAKEEPYYGR